MLVSCYDLESACAAESSSKPGVFSMPKLCVSDEQNLAPHLASPEFQTETHEDDGMTTFRGLLVAGTASAILWGVGLVIALFLRS